MFKLINFGGFLSIVLIIGAGCAAPVEDSATSSANTENTGSVNSAKTTVSIMEDKMVEVEKGEGSAMQQKVAPEDGVVDLEVQKTVRPGSYEDYDASKLALANDGTVVLFFHAGWCPTCRTAEKNITSGSIPDGLTVLKLDYDREQDLRKKYKVTYQHTYVQVDADGNLIKKWGGSNTIEQIVNKINS